MQGLLLWHDVQGNRLSSYKAYSSKCKLSSCGMPVMEYRLRKGCVHLDSVVVVYVLQSVSSLVATSVSKCGTVRLRNMLYSVSSVAMEHMIQSITTVLSKCIL